MSDNKYAEGEQFEDKNGKYVIESVAEPHDPYDYYVRYVGRDKPDNIGKLEPEIDSDN
jgi:hypothetical protein